MNLKQFVQKKPDALFVRFFFDVEFEYFVTHHYALYIKYDLRDKDKSIEIFNCLITSWSSLQLDKKYVIKGYDKVFDTKSIINEFQQIENVEIKEPEKWFYILQYLKTGV